MKTAKLILCALALAATIPVTLLATPLGGVLWFIVFADVTRRNLDNY